MIRISTLVLAALATLSIPVAAQAEGDHGQASWGYAGAGGFQNWGDLDAKYHACKDGQKQSPINIHEYASDDLPSLAPTYKSTDAEVINNGHTIQVNMADSGALNVDGQTYDLLQFHFHTPSEHYIDGAPYPMEVHFVHQAKDGTLGVVGVLFELGASNAAIDKIWKAIPAAGAKGNNITLSGMDLLPDSLDYYKYEGSLTTPPCSEGVQWHVVKSPLTMSEEQLLAFQSLFSVNARPVQPLNTRKVTGK